MNMSLSSSGSGRIIIDSRPQRPVPSRALVVSLFAAEVPLDLRLMTLAFIALVRAERAICDALCTLHTPPSIDETIFQRYEASTVPYGRSAITNCHSQSQLSPIILLAWRVSLCESRTRRLSGFGVPSDARARVGPQSGL